MEKNIILFINSVDKATIDSIHAYGKKQNRKFRIGVIREHIKKDWDKKAKKVGVDLLLTINSDKPLKIMEILKPYQEQFLAISCRGEANIALFSKVVPYLPYLKTPSTESLFWATDKLAMRQQFFAYNKSITPKFTVVSDSTPETLQKIKKEVGFPLVIKPANLASSLLVSICYHEQELADTLKKTVRKIAKVYKDNKRKVAPKLLVEEFMDGGMYSIDGYVNSLGKIYFCPLAHIKTGRAVGFDDFFGYQCLIPTKLDHESIIKAEKVASESVRALGLRSTTVHIELMRLEGDKWKVIELGPRKGGFRSKLYELTYGIDHNLNDVLIRMSKKPVISKRLKGYAVVMKFFAKKEGVLKQIKGVRNIKKLQSFVSIAINKKRGDRCKFAKNGGTSVCNLYLFNKNRTDLLADIRRVEKTLEVTLLR